MLSVAIDYLQGETGLVRVVFCLYGEEAFGVFEGVLKKVPMTVLVGCVKLPAEQVRKAENNEYGIGDFIQYSSG